MAATKLDLTRLPEYRAAAKPALVDTTPGKYLVVAGKGPPGGQAFQDAIASLYPVAYTLKFQAKAKGRDFKVPSLESLWQAKGPEVPQDAAWQALIRVPDATSAADVKRALATLDGKGKSPPASVRLRTLKEGTCVQMLHVGPYAKETADVHRMMAFAAQHGYKPKDWHHEIYLSDPRRVAPAKLRTILRHPLRVIQGRKR